MRHPLFNDALSVKLTVEVHAYVVRTFLSRTRFRGIVIGFAVKWKGNKDECATTLSYIETDGSTKMSGKILAGELLNGRIVFGSSGARKI